MKNTIQMFKQIGFVLVIILLLILSIGGMLARCQTGYYRGTQMRLEQETLRAPQLQRIQTLQHPLLIEQTRAATK